MAKARSGYIQQLPSGAFRVSVYAGTDPLTGREIRLRRTCKTERAAQIELGRLLEQAAAGSQPETDATVAQLMDRYAEVAYWDLSTRKANEHYIRRVIKPALGHLQVRKLRGPLLDLLYAQLRRCSDPMCTGKPFTEHRNAPVLAVDPASRQPAWQQIADTIGNAIRSGMLAPGEPLPSVREMSALQDVPAATLQHALAVLADEGLILIRQGRTAIVAGDTDPARRSGRAPRGRDHDCRRAGCKPHVCKPMTAKTIRNIHSILSGAFATARRWEWVTGNPAESAKPPAASRRPLPATSPEDVAKVIADGRKAHPEMALYLWLVAITGARRGELCALQVCDVDLDKGVLHIAFNYVVVGGRRVRKDTKTHQDRYLAIDPVTCAMIGEHLDAVRTRLADVGVELHEDAYVFSNDPAGAMPWNPDWASHKARDLAAAAGVKLNIKGLRHYTAGQLLAARFDLRNTAARLGHGSGGATTLRHYADPVSEVDRRAAAYLAQLTAGSPAGALRGARSPAAHALAAPIARVIARMAFATLGLSGDPVHEPVHGRPTQTLAAIHGASYHRPRKRNRNRSRNLAGCGCGTGSGFAVPQAPVNRLEILGHERFQCLVTWHPALRGLGADARQILVGEHPEQARQYIARPGRAQPADLDQLDKHTEPEDVPTLAHVRFPCVPGDPVGAADGHHGEPDRECRQSCGANRAPDDEPVPTIPDGSYR
jgi:integrase